MLMCALAPSSAGAAETGVVPDITWGISSKDQDNTAGALQELGGGWVRLSLSWSDWVEPSEGNYSTHALSHFDRGIDLARAAGYKVLVMIEQSPDWARTSSNQNAPPDDYADLATYARFIANRYIGKVEAYEIWNEPNLAWAWPSGPDGGEYAQMLKTVAPAIRAVDSNAEIVYAGLYKNNYAFVQNSYHEIPNLGDYYDVMALHPYTTLGRSPESVQINPNGKIDPGSFVGYREVRKSMQNYGDTKPIWFTEFGWSTTSLAVGVSPQTQADYLVKAYECMRQDPYIQMATWYNLRNEFWESNADEWAPQLGLMSTNFTRKPAFYALKNYVPGSGSCTYNYPSSAPDPTPTPDPGPDPTATPSTTDPDPTDEPVVSSSSVRASSMLSVSRAQIRSGRLEIAGRVARGAGGKVRGVARYKNGERRFGARIDGGGRIRINKRLRGARDASSARVTLVFAGNSRYEQQRVTLKAARRAARLQVRDAGHGASARKTRVQGSVVRGARGSVRLHLTYSTEDGRQTSTAKAKIRHGRFGHAMKLPSDATDAVLRAVFAGDGPRGIAGQSVALKLGS